MVHVVMFESSRLVVVIRNKENVLFSGAAMAVTSVNDKGLFDVLGKHENFISLIKDKIVVHVDQKEEKEFKIENGIIRVFNDKIFAFVNFKQ
jgi:F0F1-type ATP synthase epsilon subunit